MGQSATVTNAVTSNVIPQYRPRMMNRACKTTVFCDFDGPIVDVSDRYYNTYKLALAETVAHYHRQNVFIPCQPLDRDDFWQMKRSRRPDVEIARLSGLEPEQIQFFLSRVGEIVNQPQQLHLDKIQGGVAWALNWLKIKGVKLVLVTLREQDQAANILRNFDLIHLFDGIYGTQQASAAYQNQPQLKTQLLATAIAEQLPFGCDGSRVWMVGDTEADIIAARSAGIQSAGVTCGIRTQQVLEQLAPNAIFADLLSFTLHLVAQSQVAA